MWLGLVPSALTQPAHLCTLWNFHNLCGFRRFATEHSCNRSLLQLLIQWFHFSVNHITDDYVIKWHVVGWDWTEHSGLPRPVNIHMFLLSCELCPKSCSMYNIWRSHRPMLFGYGIFIKEIVQQKIMKILSLFTQHQSVHWEFQTCAVIFAIEHKIWHFWRIVSKLFNHSLCHQNSSGPKMAKQHNDLFWSVPHTNLF